MASPLYKEDMRAAICGKSRGDLYLFGRNTNSNILKPLIDMGGIVFPYTPTVTFGTDVTYDDFGFTHSNYPSNAFRRSKPRDIVVEGIFTAQTQDEAKYVLAVMHFLRSVTKSYFGVRDKDMAGTAPPVFLFNYLGERQFKYVPVLMKDYSYTLQNDADYVPVIFNQSKNYVPTKLTISITMTTYHNPRSMRENFSLTEFIQGVEVLGGFI